jgi:hypothetical protein
VGHDHLGLGRGGVGRRRPRAAGSHRRGTASDRRRRLLQPDVLAGHPARRPSSRRRTFEAGEFLARLDVCFANLYFTAYAADAAGTEVSPAWVPLFEARVREHTHPIRFALAGMNAHICHDVPAAVVSTCAELDRQPLDDCPEHRDFTRTGDVLADAQEVIKGWFSTGVVAMVDRLGGSLDDGFASFGIHLSRAAAWQTSEVMWELSTNERLDRLFREGLSRSVEMTSRGILL